MSRNMQTAAANPHAVHALSLRWGIDICAQIGKGSNVYLHHSLCTHTLYSKMCVSVSTRERAKVYMCVCAYKPKCIRVRLL